MWMYLNIHNLLISFGLRVLTFQLSRPASCSQQTGGELDDVQHGSLDRVEYVHIWVWNYIRDFSTLGTMYSS